MAQSTSIDLSIGAIPSNPAPGEVVTLTAQSYGVDLTQSTLIWTYNTATVAQGVGKTSISLKAPAAGTAGVITVSVQASGTQPGASSTIVLRPGSSDVLWEAADAHTPPFYKGKALLPVGGLVRLTAIPSTGAPTSLSYGWSRNNSALQAESGYGKSSLVFRTDPLNGQERVDLTINGGTFSGVNTVRLNTTTPLAIAYETKEGFVDFSRGYDSTISLNKPGVILHFEPYYFSTPTNSKSDLAIDATVAGDSVALSDQYEIALSRPEGDVRNTIALAITTASYSLQHLEKTFTLLFNQ
jgi:hypothetical protein